MKLRKSKDGNGQVRQKLEVSKYEAEILYENAANLKGLSKGDYSGICIDGANIEINLIKS